MPITYHYGDLLDSGAYAIVNTVNCVGVMGKGLALQVAKRYPECVTEYKEYCQIGAMRPGAILITDIGHHLIFHMATKNHWRDPSRLEWVESGLCAIREFHAHTYGFTSLALGKPGCGLGGLSWDQVGPLVRAYLGDLECDVRVYIQHGDREY